MQGRGRPRFQGGRRAAQCGPLDPEAPAAFTTGAAATVQELPTTGEAAGSGRPDRGDAIPVDAPDPANPRANLLGTDEPQSAPLVGAPARDSEYAGEFSSGIATIGIVWAQLEPPQPLLNGRERAPQQAGQHGRGIATSQFLEPVRFWASATLAWSRETRQAGWAPTPT